MDIKKEEKCIDYSVCLFLDDYNYLKYGIFHDELAASLNDSTINMNTVIVLNYVEMNFQIYLEENLAQPEFKGIKFDGTYVWLYFTVKFGQIPDSISIKNKLFNETSRDQINLLILSNGSNEKGYTFDVENKEQRIALNNL